MFSLVSSLLMPAINVQAATPPVPSITYTVLAAGERTAVLNPTSNNQTTNNNGTEWYYTTTGAASMGFAPGGAVISQNSADIQDRWPGDPTSTQRLSWHAVNGNLSAGWRAGSNTDLGSGWNRYIYQADTIYKKQKEIYEYRKGVKQDSAEDQKKLTEKRTEWRNWLKENNLSVKYFSGLI